MILAPVLINTFITGAWNRPLLPAKDTHMNPANPRALIALDAIFSIL
jgi:hypothetical protein